MAVDLTPLPYHLSVAARLEALEPRAWSLFARAVESGERAASPVPSGAPVADAEPGADPAGALPPDPPATDDLEQRLLRHAYRLEPSSHPRVHAAAARAAGALALDLPVTIYQLEGTTGANASLVFRPGEAVLALSGNLLALLTDDELTACFGHELAHHVLWRHDRGRVLVADRLLDALAVDVATPGAWLETHRRFDLATELFADRGSLLAAGDLHVAVASLVKVTTGLADVDATAYLRQAEAAHPERGSEGTTHPETVLRAWALSRWHAGAGDPAIATLLAPALDIEHLDILDRERLEALTRGLVLDMLAAEWMRSEAVTAHARHFGVEVTPVPPSAGRRPLARTPPAAAPAPVATRLPDPIPPETGRYLSYVLLDLATVDPELDDEPLVEATAVARAVGLDPSFAEVARRELSVAARAWDGIGRRAAGRRTPGEPPQAAPPSPEPALAESALEPTP